MLNDASFATLRKVRYSIQLRGFFVIGHLDQIKSDREKRGF